MASKQSPAVVLAETPRPCRDMSELTEAEWKTRRQRIDPRLKGQGMGCGTPATR